MKSWWVRILRKSTPDMVNVVTIDAPTSQVAANLVEGGPVRLFYKGKDYKVQQ